MQLEEAQTRFIQKIEDMYISGKDNAYKTFLNHPSMLLNFTKQPGESDVEYVRRCAEKDFVKGTLGKAIYQEVWDEIVKAVS